MNKSLPAILLLLGVLTGLLMSAKFSVPFEKSPDPYEAYNALQHAALVLSDEQKDLQEQMTLLRQEIDSLQNIGSGSVENIEKLDELKAKVGLSAESGKGVSITLDNVSSIDSAAYVDEAYCYAADLRDILNLLRASGASALAINDQRIVALTALNCLGTSVLINNTRMLPPYYITALSAKPDLLINNLETEKFLPSLYQRSRNNQVHFEFKNVAELTIPVYKGNLSANYLN